MVRELEFIRLRAPAWLRDALRAERIDTNWRVFESDNAEELLATIEDGEHLLLRRPGGPAVYRSVERADELDAPDPQVSKVHLRFEPQLPDDLRSSQQLTLRPVEPMARLRVRDVVELNPPLEGAAVHDENWRPLAQEVELSDVHRGVQYQVLIGSNEPAVTGSPILIGDVRVVPPAALVVPWHRAHGIEFVVTGVSDAMGAVYAKPIAGNKGFSRWTDVQGGSGWRSAELVRPGDYELILVGIGWRSAPLTVAYTHEGLDVPVRLEIPCEPVPFASVTISVGGVVQEDAGLFHASNEQGPFGPWPSPSQPCFAVRRNGAVHVVGLANPVVIYLWIAEHHLYDSFELAPGDVVDRKYELDEVGTFVEALERARNLRAEKPELTWISLQLELPDGGVLPQWMSVKSLNLTEPGALDEERWRMPVRPNARYRLRSMGAGAETFGVFVR